MLVVSDDLLDDGPADPVVVLPITSTRRRIPPHVRRSPPEGGARAERAVLREAVRSFSKARLVRRWGAVSDAKPGVIEDVLGILPGHRR